MRLLNSYGRFAEVYDQLMQDIPYDAYVQWVAEKAPASQFPTLLDIGCGTGVMLEKLLAKGYQAAGLDLSEEMLMIANERLNANGQQALLVCQSMDELEGFVDLDIITIPIDSINYLPEVEQVKETISRAFEALKSGGHLFFDVHSLFKMNEIFMDGPFTYDDGEITYLWDTEAGEAPHSVHHDMTFFVQAENDLFERFEEYHFQRTFPLETYVAMLEEVGFRSIEVTADFENEKPSEQSQRIFFHAVK
ncbi:MAG: class I SAM-dependent methyltransferase [Kurthia sp.]|nr:class I SAM-dependent methyltransferase [Candidatus Kurthia equi]